MYHRVVSLILLPFVLLTQSASLGHVHGGSQPAGHGDRAHFHTAFTAHDHEHGHHHDDSGDHRHRGDEDDASERHALAEPPQDHDADAVFVEVDVFVDSQRVGTGNELTGSVLWVGEWLDFSAIGLTDPRQFVCLRTHAPPPGCYCCPIYIRHLALLI